eukprot:1400688-Pyramimonas_sp.AAC.1
MLLIFVLLPYLPQLLRIFQIILAVRPSSSAFPSSSTASCVRDRVCTAHDSPRAHPDPLPAPP